MSPRVALLSLLFATVTASGADDPPADAGGRVVLVELFTSQG
jgi:hypothetical protein